MKNKTFPLIFVGLALTLTAPNAFALPKIGLEFEAVFPFSSETRDLFGSTLTGVGVGFGNVVPKAGGRFAPDLLVAREEKNQNELAFYGAGVQYRRTFDDVIKDDAKFVPYYGAGIGAAYGKVELVGRPSDSKVVPSGSIFLGSSVGKSGLVEVRARALGKVGGVDFSGLSINLGVRF